MDILDRAINYCQYVNRNSEIMNTPFFLAALALIWVLQSFLLGAIRASHEESERLVAQQKAIAKLYPKGQPLPY